MVNSILEGWEESVTILVALWMHREVNIGERGADDLICCTHNLLESCAVGSVAIPVQYSDAAGQDALDGAPVERCENRWLEVHLLQLAEEMQALLSSLDQ